MTTARKWLVFARTCVGVSQNADLPSSIDIQSKLGTWMQTIEFESIPFFFFKCRKMGHCSKKFPLNARKDKENHQSNPKTIWRKKLDGEGQASNTNTLNEESSRKPEAQRNTTGINGKIEPKDPNVQKNQKIREKSNVGPKEDGEEIFENVGGGKRDDDFLSSTLNILSEAKDNGYLGLEDIPIQGLSLDISIPILTTTSVECSPLSDPLRLGEKTTLDFFKDTFENLS